MISLCVFVALGLGLGWQNGLVLRRRSMLLDGWLDRFRNMLLADRRMFGCATIILSLGRRSCRSRSIRRNRLRPHLFEPGGAMVGACGRICAMWILGLGNDIFGNGLLFGGSQPDHALQRIQPASLGSGGLFARGLVTRSLLDGGVVAGGFDTRDRFFCGAMRCLLFAMLGWLGMRGPGHRLLAMNIFRRGVIRHRFAMLDMLFGRRIMACGNRALPISRCCMAVRRRFIAAKADHTHHRSHPALAFLRAMFGNGRFLAMLAGRCVAVSRMSGLM